MPRKPRPLDRDGGLVRDASLVVIASEDRYAVKQYFARFHSTRVQVKVLATENTLSSPKAVYKRLAEFKKEHDLGEGDVLWLCLDTDHWAQPGHRPALQQVLSGSHANGFKVALSCPCFEFWLLLHFTAEPHEAAGVDLSSTTAVTCDALGDAIRGLAGGYNKKRVDLLPLTESQVRQAMDRAKSRWNAGDGTIPDRPLTGVHRILEAIDQRGAFSFR
jgi:hypothetical protein